MKKMKTSNRKAPHPVLSSGPFPASHRRYLTGSRPDLRVPVREIELSDGTRFAVYDTSGPYTDPGLEIDPYVGIRRPRESWIRERGDTEKLANFTSRFTRKQERNHQLEAIRFPRMQLPRRARPGGNVSQMHYARKGIVTPEMEFVALRENLAHQRSRTVRFTPFG